MKKRIGLFLTAMTFLLAACGNRQAADPFQPLSQATNDPRLESAFEATRSVWQLQHVPTQSNEGLDALAQIEPAPNEQSLPLVSTEESPFSAQPDLTQNEQIQNPQTLNEQIPLQPAQQEVQPVQQEITLYGATADGQTTYQMQNGDSISCLGRRFNIDQDQLLRANGLGSEAEALAGSQIILPSQISQWNVLSGPRNLRSHPTVWDVQQGDTLFSIACAFGAVYPEQIASANGLTLNSALTPGQQISIP